MLRTSALVLQLLKADIASSWVLDKPLWTVRPFTGEEKAVLPLRIKGSSWELGAGAATTE